jgi:hypothetical protein
VTAYTAAASPQPPVPEVEDTLGQLDRPAHVVVSVEEVRALQPDAPERRMI